MSNEHTAERLAWNLRDAALACGVSVAYLRKVIDKGELRPTRAGRKILVADSELKRWLGLLDNKASTTKAEGR